MTETLLSQEGWVRVGGFVLALAAVGLAEGLLPRRRRDFRRLQRWPSNLGLVALDALVARVIVPILPIGLAAVARDQGWGLFNRWRWAEALEIALAVVALDFVIYLQHVMFHAVPILWRLHRMHHADLDFDVTTGIRFHPVEMLISTGVKLAAVAAFGPTPLAVLIFEVFLNGTSLFNHANLRLPMGVDRVLRWLVVTPDMHRVHHSVLSAETHSNFGFNLPWWDRLFGTYRAQPRLGHDGMTIGLPIFRRPEELRLDRLLFQPFRSESAPTSLEPPHEEGSGI